MESRRDSRARAREGLYLPSRSKRRSRLGYHARRRGFWCLLHRRPRRCVFTGSKTVSRDDGFPVADVDSAYFDDAKMRDLWQRLHDSDRMARAVVLHAATLLGSWRQGERITVGQASPLWMIQDDDLVSDLKAVRMLDKTGRIPLGSWNKWFGVAFKRREVRRETGRAGGLASGKARSSDAEASVQGESSPTEPVRPSVPPGPSVPTGSSVPPPRARGRNGLKALDGEDAIRALDVEYAAGRIDGAEYHARREALSA
jgi:hypothetical protein